MKKYVLDYSLSEGYIASWLATGPIYSPLNAQPNATESELEFRQRILAELSLAVGEAAMPPFTLPPVELDRVGVAFWEVRRSREDHLLETTVFANTWQHVQRWAFVTLHLPVAGSLTLDLDSVGAAAIWLNGSRVLRTVELRPHADQQASHHTQEVHAKRGNNTLALLLEDVLLGPGLLSAALRLSMPGERLANARIRLSVLNELVNERKAAEALYEIAYVAPAVMTADDVLKLRGADRLVGSSPICLCLRSPDGSQYAQSFGDLKPGASISSLYGHQLPPGPMEMQIIPGLESFYNFNFRPERILPFMSAPFRLYRGDAGDYETRLVLLCKEMTHMKGIFGEMSKMMLGWWQILDLDEIRHSLTQVNQRAAGCLIDLLGVAGVAGRLAKFKQLPAEILPEIEGALKAFPYAETAAACAAAGRETDLLLVTVSRVLAGQKYARASFGATGRSGAQERKAGEAQATALLLEGGRQGWRDGSAHLDERVAALAHLVDLAKSEDLAELAGILLDQELFGLAQHSLQGGLGLPQLDANPQALRSLRLAPSAALNLLLFGTGCNNRHLIGAFSLGIARDYRLPSVIAGIAQSQVEEAWNVERSARPETGWEANLAAFKTPDSLLASLQDYRPGERGGRVNPWQATLGSEALVFSNHPAALNQAEARQAGTWCGSASLPRVAQWKDSLICLYNLPEHATLNFTHVHFPTYAFDEYRHEKGWYFARKGNAYLAVYASTQARLLEAGDAAQHELRAFGPQTAWLVQLGRQAVDGNFGEFCAQVLGSSLSIYGLAVQWKTLRGEHLKFDWTGPLLRSGKEQPLKGGKRYEGPFVDAIFPSEKMDIGYGDQLMRLTIA